MTTPPKKSTLRLAKGLGILAACLAGPLPLAGVVVALAALVILVLGCELKGF